MPNPPTHADIEQTLEQLRVQIQSAVRAEQLVDQLTKLSNDDALNEWIQSQIEDAKDFWLAFIEIDHFKSVNDEFGYDLADELLRRVAGQLKNAAMNFFTKHAVPFRAHGDEFFIGGPGDGTGVSEALEQIRTTIAALRIEALPKTRSMTCTVSIGWVTSRDPQNAAKDLTRRGLRGMLETAVAEAKCGRNRVLRYKPSMEKLPFDKGAPTAIGAAQSSRWPFRPRIRSSTRCTARTAVIAWNDPSRSARAHSHDNSTF